MNWKHKYNGNIINNTCYNRLLYTEKLHYKEVGEKPSHLVDNIVDGIAIFSLVSDIFSNSSSSSSDNSSNFGGFGGGDFSGGGASGDF